MTPTQSAASATPATLDPALFDAIREVMRMLVEGHASRAEVVVKSLNMKVTGCWIKHVIRLEIK